MTLQILSGGELVYEPWPWAGDWHVFSGNVGDFKFPDRSMLDPDWIWKTQRHVRTVVRFLARNQAKVDMLGYRRELTGEGARTRLDRDEPLARLLRNPSPTTTGFDFSRARATDLCMWERWCAMKLRADDARPFELHRMPPRRWRFRRDPDDTPTAIRVFRTAEEQRQQGADPYVDLPLDRFVWMDGYPVKDDTMVTSPMEYLADILAEEAAASQSRVDLYNNGPRISGWIERGLDAPDWKPKGRERFRDEMRATVGPEGTRRGGWPIIEDGMKLHPGEAINPQQAQMIEARQLSMAEVASAFNVPPELVGAREGTYSNVKAYKEILYTETLGAAFAETEQAYNARLVPDVADPDSVFVEHNVAEQLRLSFEEQIDVLMRATGAPIMLRREARRRLNLEDLDDAEDDALVVPLNVLIGGQTSPADSRPDIASLDGRLGEWWQRTIRNGDRVAQGGRS